MTAEPTELLPCPFCGNRPSAGVGVARDHLHFIECIDCPAVMEDDTEAAAIAAWNTRDPIITEMVEALEGMIRLADMGLEESLREPEENGNYATYNRAKAALAKVRGK